MVDDIVPSLLDAINQEFDANSANSATLKKALQLLNDQKATYLDVNAFAVEAGKILSNALQSNVTAEILPDGKMYFNIADRLLNSTLQKNHEIITGYAADVQTQLNQQAGFNLRAQIPTLNQDKIAGMVNRLSSESDFSAVSWMLGEPIVNFSQSIVDDMIKANVDFHAKAGLRPKITRRTVGRCCKWCRSLAGSYNYPDVPHDIYRRHQNCRCTVDYNPGDGTKQDVWSKRWRDPNESAKIESRKLIGLVGESGAKNYIRETSKDFLLSAAEIKQLNYAFTQYDAIKNSNQPLQIRKIYSNIGQFKEMKNFSKSDVEIAFNHVFNDEHDLSSGKGLFIPDYDMAQSWTRLINNNSIKNHDLVLLRHERLEHDFMYITDSLDYNAAHEKTDEVYSYTKALKNFKEGKK